jgi:hypothetical protein
LPFGHSPREGESFLNVSEIRLIAAIFSHLRGDAADRQRSVAIKNNMIIIIYSAFLCG